MNRVEITRRGNAKLASSDVSDSTAIDSVRMTTQLGFLPGP